MTKRQLQLGTRDASDISSILKIAGENNLDLKRVQRLIGKCEPVGESDRYSFFRKLRWSVEYLLNFTPAHALDILESDDLDRTVNRLHFISLVCDPYRSFYTLRELGQVTEQFVDHLELCKERLLETGYPGKRFPASPWLDWRLSCLYRTKLPAKVVLRVRARSKGWVPVGFGDDQANREVLDYSWSPTAMSHPYPPELWIGAPLALNMPREYMATAYGLPPTEPSRQAGDHVPYADAPHMRGLTLDQAYVLERGRPYVFNVKVAVLQHLRQSILLREKPGLLWERSFDVLKGMLSRWEIKAHLLMDRPNYLDAYDQLLPADQSRVGPITGGLSFLLHVVCHFASELQIGTMWRVREALGDIVELQRDGRRIFKPASEWFSPDQIRAIDDAMALMSDLDEKRFQFDNDFHEAAKGDIDNGTLENVVAEAKVPMREREKAKSILASHARYVEDALQKGFTPSQAESIDSATLGRNVFRCDGDFWTLIYEGKKILVRESLGIQYIANLLSSTGKSIKVEDLYATVTGKSPESAPRAEAGSENGLADESAAAIFEKCIENELDGEDKDAGCSTSSPSRPLDKIAKRKRLHDLLLQIMTNTEDITTARQAGAIGSLDTLRRLTKERRELWNMVKELKYDFPNDGQLSRDDVEKLRKAVRKCIDTSIANLHEQHQSLARHLRSSIRKGRRCRYEPERSQNWVLE